MSELSRVDIPIGLINADYKEQLSDLFDEIDEVTKLKVTISEHVDAK